MPVSTLDKRQRTKHHRQDQRRRVLGELMATKKDSNNVRSLLLPAIGTLGTGFAVFISVADLSKARMKYGVKPPNTEPDESLNTEDKQTWKRAYRQYVNLIEWTSVTQPIFWTSALLTREAFGVSSKPFKAVSYAAALWPLIRIGYGKAYQQDAEKRQSYFGASTMCLIVSLLIGSVSAAKIARQEFSRK